MMHLLDRLYRDESGFVVSAELILIATIAVLGMVVGLSSAAHALNHELEDVSAAFGSMTQSFTVFGARGHFANWHGSSFQDHADFCDSEGDLVPLSPSEELPQ
jgi:Flp pilus assembly pilin Flp